MLFLLHRLAHVQDAATIDLLQQRDGVIEQMGKAWMLGVVLQLQKQRKSLSVAPPSHVYEQLHTAVHHLAPYASSLTTATRHGRAWNLAGYLALDHAGRIEAYQRLRAIGSESVERKTRTVLDSPNPRRYAETLLGFTQDLIYACRLMSSLVPPAVRPDLRTAQEALAREALAHEPGSLSSLEMAFLRWRNQVLLALWAAPYP